MIISADLHVLPYWVPPWLREQVENPDCSEGTHPRLRWLAKWLTVYFSEQPGEAERWLRHAAQYCDRNVPEGELTRLLIWARGRFGENGTAQGESYAGSTNYGAQPDLDEIYALAEAGPNLEELREASPEKLHSTPTRNTARVLDRWGHYAGLSDPFVCFGADDCFWTRPLSTVRHLLHIHAQIVPSPMRVRSALTQGGYLSEHSLEGTGERTMLVAEFDFAKVTPSNKPTVWVPLVDRIADMGRSVLDLNASLLAKLATERPLWMVVFSGGKSLQGWFPCRGADETELHQWFNASPRRLGACSSTWCKSQFVRTPDGTRAPNREGKSVRQTIEFFNPSAL
jgi:hypothetical protein